MIAVDHKNNKVKVEGVNMITKHTKPSAANQNGGIVSQEGPIDASNVLVVCPVCNKATRVSYKVEGEVKARICKKCGAILDGAKEVKEVKKEAKKATTTKKTSTAKKTTTTKKTTKKVAEAEAPAENN